MSDKRPLQFLVMRAGTLLGALLLVSVPAAAAETHDIGLTAKGGTIRAAIVRGSSDSAPVVAIVGGLSGPLGMDGALLLLALLPVLGLGAIVSRLGTAHR